MKDLNNLFFTTAHAETSFDAPPTPPEASWIANLLPIALIFVVFYFLLIRPQANAIKKHQVMVNEMKKGDKVLTSGGIIGKIKNINEDIATVEIAEGVDVQVSKVSIKEVL